MQELYESSFSDNRIADEFRSDEIPTDLVNLLRRLENFCAN